MKAYVVSLALGVLVGVIYALFQVRSPAPPMIALLGLLGILAGEQLPSLVRQLWAKEPLHTSWIQRHVMPHVFGDLPCADLPAGTGLANRRASRPSNSNGETK